MKILVMLIVITLVMLSIRSHLGFSTIFSSDSGRKNQAIRKTEAVKSSINDSVQQHQDKLDQALQNAGAQ